MALQEVGKIESKFTKCFKWLERRELVHAVLSMGDGERGWEGVGGEDVVGGRKEK